MKNRFLSHLALGLLLLVLFSSACTPPSPTPPPLANLDDLKTAPGHLNAALQEEEPETYAGLWIEPEPELRVIALFTRDGEKTLQPYIAGSVLEGRVEVRQAKVTLPGGCHMPTNTLYHPWFQHIQELRPNQRIIQVCNFVWLMVGIYQSQSVCMICGSRGKAS